MGWRRCAVARRNRRAKQMNEHDKLLIEKVVQAKNASQMLGYVVGWMGATGHKEAAKAIDKRMTELCVPPKGEQN